MIGIIVIVVCVLFINIEISRKKYDETKKEDEKKLLSKIAKENKNETLMNNIVDASKSEYTYDKMIKDLVLLKKKYRDKIDLNILGTTYDNRNIYEVVFGNILSEKHILVHGGIHGREYLNSLLLMKQLEHYLQSYEIAEYKGVPYRELFKNIVFHIVPMANPDGVTISQIGIDGIKNSYLKKLINKCYYEDIEDAYTSDDYENYLKKWKANAKGVDLNRNFNASWNLINQSPHPSFENYKGKCYESELETKALIKLTNRYRFIATISYHSSGNIIYWDYTNSLKKNECSNLADIVKECTKYEKAMSDSNYSEVVSGGYKDWASSKSKNPIPSITIETGEGDCPLDICEFKKIWKYNVDIWAACAYELSKHKKK